MIKMQQVGKEKGDTCGDPIGAQANNAKQTRRVGEGLGWGRNIRCMRAVFSRQRALSM
jgi:hypothetical protein